MLFSSMIFVYAFLPLVAGLYWLSPRALRNAVLLAASILFYAWGEPIYVVVMLVTILVNYCGALLLGGVRRGRRLVVAGTIMLNLSLLVYFKYFNFLVDICNSAFGTGFDSIKVVMPIGISFYTFQSLSYVVDVYRGEVAVQRNIAKLALYVSFFPQLVAGPIVKYHDIAHEIDRRTVGLDDMLYGIRRFVVGLAKKMLLANTLGAVADKVFAQSPTSTHPATAWIGALAYAFQIFYDFSGYSDMAIGLGRMFGFHFLENFNYPYISKSITEFWRRWHVSLSTWFREYLYIPLGGNRAGTARTYVNLLIVFLATGIWHGASWNFVVWGLWHGFFIVLERVTGLHKKTGGAVFAVMRHACTLLVVLFGWVLFRAEDLPSAVVYARNMLGLLPDGFDAPNAIPHYVDNTEIFAMFFAIMLSAPVTQGAFLSERLPRALGAVRDVVLVALFVLASIWMASSTYNPFIYFRF